MALSLPSAVFCCRGKCYGIAGTGSECIAALASCNAVAYDFNISHRRIADLNVALRVCRSLGRENPFAIGKILVIAELVSIFRIAVKEAADIAAAGLVDYTDVCTSGAHQYNFAGLAAQIADGAVVDNGDNAVFRVFNPDVGSRYARLDFYCAGMIERDGIRIIRID